LFLRKNFKEKPKVKSSKRNRKYHEKPIAVLEANLFDARPSLKNFLLNKFHRGYSAGLSDGDLSPAKQPKWLF